jgi:arylsulfatase A-like enzyme
VFTSDHGFHMGQHRLEPDKGRPYEEDIEIPLYVRGPGVPAGRTLRHKVLNLDFAPTFAELGGAEPPPA